ncbi:hypothetical protein [Virgibacillus sp. DJP39]|uniref:hypothetical protein n=1 Tax=Virgibacillus sp. DJP39 TaxID=3409790 RepID=UPI003BB7F797
MKKVLRFFLVFLLIIGIGYGIENKNSPTNDSKLQVAAATKGLNDNGDAAVKVFFSFDLDKVPMFSNQHTISISWSEGWKIEGYNLREDGIYSKNNIELLQPSDYSDSFKLKIDSNKHLNKDAFGEGYVILTSTNKEKLGQRVKSAVSVNFNYQSLVKDFKLGESTAWDNREALDVD